MGEVKSINSVPLWKIHISRTALDMSNEISLVELSYDEEELLRSPSLVPDKTSSEEPNVDKIPSVTPIPGPPDSPHPDQMMNLTRTVPPKNKFRFNHNHPEVPDELLLPLEKDIQRKVAIANTRMAANTKTCRTRDEFNELVGKHQQAIRQLGASTKNLIVKTARSRRPPLSKEELGKLRFAVAKRFTVWIQKLENVVRNTRSWDERAHLWSDLVEANRHHYAVYYLRRSLNVSI